MFAYDVLMYLRSYWIMTCVIITMYVCMYIDNIRDRVKRLAEEYMNEHKYPEVFHVTLGDMWTDRCVHIANSQLLKLQTELYNHLLKQGFKLRELHPLHVDLRGRDVGAVELAVQSRGNWHI